MFEIECGITYCVRCGEWWEHRSMNHDVTVCRKCVLQLREERDSAREVIDTLQLFLAVTEDGEGKYNGEELDKLRTATKALIARAK